MPSEPEITEVPNTPLRGPSDSLKDPCPQSNPWADPTSPLGSSSTSRVDNMTQSSNASLRTSTFSMKHCRLPIELCEAIMDVLFESPDFGQLGHLSDEFKTLWACRNVCPEWNIRATALLHLNSDLKSPQEVSDFVSTLRGRSQSRLYFRAEGLWLDWSSFRGDRNLSRSRALFTLHSLPNLEFLHIDGCQIDIGSSRLMRLRPPFLKGIRRLVFNDCQFDSWRTVLDLLWACPNLNDVRVTNCSSDGDTLTPESAARLSAARRNLRGCEQLRKLEIEVRKPSGKLSLPPGDVFGSVLTELMLDMGHDVYNVETQVHLLDSRSSWSTSRTTLMGSRSEHHPCFTHSPQDHRHTPTFLMLS
ncbi:hypothetical protein C8Q79DRAFT_332684 [Trametes meyenii]|nr:hypothetical protein C8Q79DRAFT_332684 [Trametes meyenii]